MSLQNHTATLKSDSVCNRNKMIYIILALFTYNQSIIEATLQIDLSLLDVGKPTPTERKKKNS